ncbi:MAG: hypothetical protein OEX04_11565 [Acidimicrobiia bacterium]|nr:hypothetical protein [Acidimicrobiia bacterium]MDH4308105.1 hypothetical protein [Acidimicrobiia bacterium]MDH5292593.1 hypothetical protein [Acidimicrobiia bacterium]
MSTRADLGGVDTVDVPGVVLAITAVMAAMASFLVGSGFGPTATALVAWLSLLLAASWVAFVDEGATTWHRMGAVVFGAVCAVGFITTSQSVWGLTFPSVALAAAVGRRRSSPRLVAAAAWLAATVFVVLGNVLQQPSRSGSLV